jgi:MGT family glycosyltransferase
LARVVFLSIPAHGHINPTLPIVSGLVAGGEQVIYYTAPAFAEKIGVTGAEIRIVSTTFDRLIEEAAMTIGRNAFSVAAAVMEASVEILGRILDSIRSENPDYIVHDSLTIYGQAVSRLLDVPAVCTVPTVCWGGGGVTDVPTWFALNMVRQGIGAVHEIARYYAFSRRLRTRYGIDFGWPLRVFSSYEELSIITTSRIFQPNADKLDRRKFLIAGPMIARAEGGSFKKQGDGKLVYVSLGTVYNNDPRFYTECFKALGDTKYRVLVAAGTAISNRRLGNAPPNFTLASTVPQLRVLRDAAVFVSHGGMNSVNEALYQGVPMVLVPKALDQFINSRRIADLNAGIYVKQPNAKNLRKAVERIMTEPDYQRSAQKLSGQIRAEASVEKALDAIDGFKRSRGIG